MAAQHTSYINSGKNRIHESTFQDQIKEALRTEVDTYSLQSFRRFQTFHGQITVVPTNDSKPYFEGCDKPVGFTKYFIEASGRAPQEVKVRIANMQIELFHGDDWTDILKVLDRIPAPTDWKKPSERMSAVEKHALTQKQWQWYYHNRKPFRFLSLPSEIREAIYSFLFPTTFQPYPYCLSRRRPWNIKQGIAHEQGNTALLRVNKQLHNEAGHVLFRDTTFLLERTGIMERVLSWTPALSKNLTRLELSFEHEQYLRLFGFYFNEDAIYDAKPAVYCLRELDLKLLTIRIGPPITYRTIYGSNTTSCQKKAVKHILRAAYPWVKGHPVEVIGFIVSKQKFIYESKMKERRQEFEIWRQTGGGTLREWDEDEGGVPVGDDGDTGEKELEVEMQRERLGVEWPPRCRCRVHCGKIKWTSE
ncbi:hypothetical protein DOTSEDRAFT_18956 [Dothistroma septosporum NZE10]|uniref:Uncharacterized protein n=1 Tax=Dothistroma septosporum (strain NZE10 / CBS 128990) TaxID=675120 RepID=N1PYB1_DOTSN|nr:hypothetical protein DOTSEDRAFT_18956 [Dothistroma septosporum NZE10]